jgi:hypothetical protein
LGGLQLFCDSVCPGVDVVPVAVVAVGTTECFEEHASGKVVMGWFDRTREASVLARPNRLTVTCDPLGFFTHAPHGSRDSCAEEAAGLAD